jgi:hypothetical protein
MKSIEQLSEQTLKRKLKAIYALPQDALSQAQRASRTQIENRLWDLHIEAHPPIHTPANFIENDEEW